MLEKPLPFLLLNPISISMPAFILDNPLTFGGDTLCQLPRKGELFETLHVNKKCLYLNRSPLYYVNISNCACILPSKECSTLSRGKKNQFLHWRRVGISCSDGELWGSNYLNILSTPDFSLTSPHVGGSTWCCQSFGGSVVKTGTQWVYPPLLPSRNSAFPYLLN